MRLESECCYDQPLPNPSQVTPMVIFQTLETGNEIDFSPPGLYCLSDGGVSE